jgi:hypothetical protein
MDRCATCKFYTAKTAGHLGSCERWRAEYAWRPEELKADEVVVENDEGWGAYMGPEFGCVLHAPRT